MRHEYRDFLKDSIRKKVDFSQTAQSRGLAPPPPAEALPARRREDRPAGTGGAGRRYRNWTWKKRSPAGSRGATTRSRRSASRSWRSCSGPRRGCDPGPRPSTTSAPCPRPAAGTPWRPISPPSGSRGWRRRSTATCRSTMPWSRWSAIPTWKNSSPGRPSASASAAAAAATFIWTAVPERMEWRYGEASYKVIALDAGHVCQNLYLACEKHRRRHLRRGRLRPGGDRPAPGRRRQRRVHHLPGPGRQDIHAAGRRVKRV